MLFLFVFSSFSIFVLSFNSCFLQFLILFSLEFLAPNAFVKYWIVIGFVFISFIIKSVR